MLATASYRITGTSSSYRDFLPTISSPLSPRSANINGRSRSDTFWFMTPNASDADSENSSHSSKSLKLNVARDASATVPFSKRTVKRAPTPRQDELKERRRNLFFRHVKDGREDKRFEARGDDMMRLDFMQRQRQWEARLAMEAPTLPSHPLDEDEVDMEEQTASDLPTSSADKMQMSAPSTQLPAFEYELDEVEQREREELEALLTYMPVAEDEPSDMSNEAEHFYSDDDDYDQLFSEIMEQEAIDEGDVQLPRTQDDVEAMDTS